MTDHRFDRIFGRLRFRHLQLLLALEQHGSLRAAASVLHATQPALSKALKELEEIVDLPLFTRTHRGLEVTSEGAVLMHGARVLLEEMQHVQSEAQAAGDHNGRSIHLRLGVPPFVAIGMFPELVQLLTKQNPTIRVTLRESNFRRILDLLLQGEIDALITIYTPETISKADSKMFVYQKLNDEDYWVIAHSKHPLTERKRVTWQELASYPWILSLRPSTSRYIIEQNFLNAGVHPPKPIVQSDSPVTNMRLAIGGIGLTLAPGQVVREAEQTKSIGRINVHPQVSPATLGLIYRKSTAEHPRIVALRKALAQWETHLRQA